MWVKNLFSTNPNWNKTCRSHSKKIYIKVENFLIGTFGVNTIWNPYYRLYYF